MSDVLDISSAMEFEVDVAGDKGINQLRSNARKHKGRGIEEFSTQNSSTTSKYKENINDTDMETSSSELSIHWEDRPPLVPKQNFSVNKQVIVGNQQDQIVPQKSVEGWVLFVTGVHEEASEEEISEKFSEVAKIKNIKTNLDRRTGFMKNYAVLEYDTYEDAFKTKERLNGTELLGIKVVITWCFIKGPEKMRK